jgi:tetratricopeptide (TPR) repeat protein
MKCCTTKVVSAGVLVFVSLFACGQTTGRSAADSMLHHAAQLLAAGNRAQADSELETIIRQFPNESRALDLLGILRAQQQRDTEAEELFQRAIQSKPDFASPHIHLGLLYMQVGQPDKAVPALQEGLRLAPDRTDASKALVEALRQEAKAAIAARKPEKALSLMIEARKRAPEDPDVLYDYGMVALRMSLLPDAIGAFQETLKIRSDDPLALYGLGRAFMNSARFEDARQQFARYVVSRPDDPSGHYALGMSLSGLQRAREAAGQFKRSIALLPAQTESYFRLGLLQLDAKDLDAAESNFRHVLSRDPKHAGALAALGHVELERKQYEEAATLLQKAIASNSSLREAHYYLGLTYARLGRKEESNQQLQIASQLDQEEAEKQRTVFTILDTGQPDAAASAGASQPPAK